MTNNDKKLNLSDKGDFYKTLIEMNPDAVLVHFKDKFIFSNKAGLKLLGASTLEELIKVPVMNIVHPDYKEKVIERIRALELDRIDIPPLREKIIRLDGKVQEVEIYGRPINYQGKDANLLIFRDITKYLEYENTIRENEIRKSAVLKALPDLVFIIDKNGIIIDYNIPEDVRLYMTRPAEFGANIKDFVPNEGIFVEYMSKIQDTLKSKKTNFLEYDFPIPGRDQTFEARFIYYEKDEVLVLIRNITERKVIEKEQRNIMKIESIGLVAGGIAHDFNNILTKIIGNINLARLDVNDSKILLKYLTEMENASFQAKKLTNQLLTFAKGGDPLTKVESIKEIIEESVTFFLSGSKSKVLRNYSKDKMTVDVESGQIEQVISNLIINADQSMPEGGIIEIKVDVLNITNKEIPGIVEGKYVAIAISDKGVGIKDEDKARIFEPYYTTKKTGTGLGLTTCYSIVKRHHGYLSLNDNTGGGSIFTVYLPFSEQKETDKRIEFTIKSSFTGKVLIMDDSVEIQELLGKMLKNLGFEYEKANDGEQTISLYKQAMFSDPFTFLIMDLTIPGGMGGRQALMELKKLDPDVKAIVSSGYSNDPVMAKYQEFGFAGVLPKPYSLNDLKRVISEVL